MAANLGDVAPYDHVRGNSSLQENSGRGGDWAPTSSGDHVHSLQDQLLGNVRNTPLKERTVAKHPGIVEKTPSNGERCSLNLQSAYSKNLVALSVEGGKAEQLSNRFENARDAYSDAYREARKSSLALQHLRTVNLVLQELRSFQERAKPDKESEQRYALSISTLAVRGFIDKISPDVMSAKEKKEMIQLIESMQTSRQGTVTFGQLYSTLLEYANRNEHVRACDPGVRQMSSLSLDGLGSRLDHVLQQSQTDYLTSLLKMRNSMEEMGDAAVGIAQLLGPQQFAEQVAYTEGQIKNSRNRFERFCAETSVGLVRQRVAQNAKGTEAPSWSAVKDLPKPVRSILSSDSVGVGVPHGKELASTRSGMRKFAKTFAQNFKSKFLSSWHLPGSLAIAAAVVGSILMFFLGPLGVVLGGAVFGVGLSIVLGYFTALAIVSVCCSVEDPIKKFGGERAYQDSVKVLNGDLSAMLTYAEKKRISMGSDIEENVTAIKREALKEFLKKSGERSVQFLWDNIMEAESRSEEEATAAGGFTALKFLEGQLIISKELVTQIREAAIGGGGGDFKDVFDAFAKSIREGALIRKQANWLAAEAE